MMRTAIRCTVMMPQMVSASRNLYERLRDDKVFVVRNYDKLHN